MKDEEQEGKKLEWKIKFEKGIEEVSRYIHISTAGILATGQCSEGPATGHLDTGFFWFPCAQNQMLRWFPRFQVANTCFSCSPPDLNLVVTNFMLCLHVK